MTRQTLSKTQAETLAALVAFHDEFGYAPTFRQLADALGLASTSGVHRAVIELERRGALIRPATKDRHATAYEFAPVKHVPSSDIYLRTLVDQIVAEGQITSDNKLVKRIRKAIRAEGTTP